MRRKRLDEHWANCEARGWTNGPKKTKADGAISQRGESPGGSSDLPV